jgi:hypothetical protein
MQSQILHVYEIKAKTNLKRMIMPGLVQKLRGEHPFRWPNCRTRTNRGAGSGSGFRYVEPASLGRRCGFL